LLAAAAAATSAHAAPQNPDLLPGLIPGGGSGLTVKSQILVLMTILGLLPVMMMMMTSFTRFVIVLSLLRQALGLQSGLPNRIITGVALILTLLVMRPVGEQIWRDAFVPYDKDKITLEQALRTAEVPLSRFMLAQTSKAALTQVAHLAGEPAEMAPMARGFTVKLAAFVLSELKSAFQIGCMLFIPFLVIVGADGDGHDDAVAAGDFAALQAAAVRPGRRLDPDREYPGRQHPWILIKDMTPDIAVDIMIEALQLVMLLAAVLVLPGLVTGVIVAVFQAATSINEQTLSFLPRLLVTLLALIVAGHWMTGKLMDYCVHVFQRAAQLVG
jgi:flagellar biosynthetic protein FliP